MINNEKNEKNLICQIHNSPIGGMCSELNCNESPLLFCIKCVVDSNLCIRKKNHKLVSIQEFTENFSKNSNFSQFKEFLQIFKTSRNIDFTKAKDSIKTYTDRENSLFEKLLKILEEKLNFLFEKEKQKIKRAEEESIYHFNIEKEIFCAIQKDFKSYFEVNSEKSLDFQNYCNILFKKYAENKITLSELFIEVSDYLTNLKSLVIKANDDRIFKAFEKINFFVSFSTKPINSFKIELENKYKLMSRTLIEELNFYFKNKEKDIQILRMNSKEGVINIDKPSSPLKKVASSNKNPTLSPKSKIKVGSKVTIKSEKEKSGSGSLGFFNKKQVKKSSSSIQEEKPKINEKNVSKYFSTFTRKTNTLIPLVLSNGYDLNFLNDDQLILIDNLKILATSNKFSFSLFNFEKQTQIFKYESKNISTMPMIYQFKHTTFNLKDVVYALNSLKELIEVTISEDGSCIHKVFQIGEELKENIIAFDLVIEEEPLFGTNKFNPIVILYICSAKSIQTWTIADESVKFINGITIASETNFTTEVLKLQFFKNSFKITKNSEFLLDKSSSNEFLPQDNKYIIYNNGSIYIYMVNIEYSPYYKVTNNSNSICNSFYVENLPVLNEAYVYSAWQNGSVLIHSLKSKILLKEVKSFNLSMSPLYSLCFINEKYLLVGGDKIVFLLNHANEKTSTIKWKNLEGKILSIKLLVEDSKNESFVTVMNNGMVHIWNNMK